MSNSIKFIKSLNNGDIINIQQLYFNFIFGDAIPGKYNPNIVYNPGDIITKLNSSNVYEIYACTTEYTTGTFNPAFWKRVSLTEIIKDGDLINGGGGGKNLIIMSETQPTDKNNKIWLEPIGERMININL